MGTYTYVLLEVSPEVFSAVEAKLIEAGGADALVDDETIDMNGLALRKREVVPVPLGAVVIAEADRKAARELLDPTQLNFYNGGSRFSQMARSGYDRDVETAAMVIAIARHETDDRWRAWVKAAEEYFGHSLDLTETGG